MGRQEPGAGGSTQPLRVSLGEGTRGPGCQDPGWGQDRVGCVRGAGLGCSAETPGAHPPLGASGPARSGPDGTLLRALHPALQDCLLGTSPRAAPSLDSCALRDGWVHGGQRPPGSS